MENLHVNVPSLNQWTPCDLKYRIPNTQYVLIIFELGGSVPVGLLEQSYYETIAVIQRQIDQGRGDAAPRGFYIRVPGVTAIAVRYTKGENTPQPPTNRDLITVFETLWYITADKDHPKPNPLFSKETKFILALDNEPNQDWAAKGVVQLVETNSELSASS